MAQFKFTGSETMVFPSLAAADGSTLVLQPGDTAELDADPGIASLEPVASAPAPAPAPAEAPQTAPEAPQSPAPAA